MDRMMWFLVSAILLLLILALILGSGFLQKLAGAGSFYVRNLLGVS